MYPINSNTCTKLKITLADCLQHPAYCTKPRGEQIYFMACLGAQNHTSAAQLTLEYLYQHKSYYLDLIISKQDNKL